MVNIFLRILFSLDTQINKVYFFFLIEIHSAPQDIIEQIQNGTNIIPGINGGVDPIQTIQNQTNINPGDYYETIRNQTGVTPPNFEVPSGNPGDYYDTIRNQTGGIAPQLPPNGIELPSGSDIQIQNCIPTNIMGDTTTTTTMAPTTVPAEKKHGKSRQNRH